MALPAAIIILIYTLFVFYFLKKKLSFLQNAFVFMVISIAARNYTTIMVLQLKWLHLTEDPFLFLVFLLNRDLIGPMLILIFINVFWRKQSSKSMLFFFLIILLCLQLMDGFIVGFGVITYIKWNFYKAFAVNIVLLAGGLGISKCSIYLKRERPELC